MSDRPFAGEPAQHDDEHRATVSSPAPRDSEVASREHRGLPTGSSLEHDARPASVRRHDRFRGSLRGARAAGSTNAEREEPAPDAPHPDSSVRPPAVRRPPRPIRREDVYTESVQGGCEVSFDRGTQDESVFGCARCEETGRTCNACVQRRHRAWQLVDRDGWTIDEAAAVMCLPAARVRVLVAQERDRLELAEHRINSIPIERARAFLEREMERDPSLTRAEVAHRMNMSQADFDHQFGYADAKTANGAKQERVGIPLASRLTLALGRAPHELEGC
jgi:hypothetical protein